MSIKKSNYLHEELSLDHLGDAKFYLESKASFMSFIHISSIASFKLFLIAWLWEYGTFSDSSVVSLKSSPWPKYTQLGTIFHYQTIGGHHARLREKENLFLFISLSLTFCKCTRSYARANDAKIVCSW